MGTQWGLANRKVGQIRGLPRDWFFGCGNRDSAYVDVSRQKDRSGDLSIRARVGGGSPLSRKSGISGPNIVYAAMQVMDLQGNPCRVQEPFPRHQA